MLRIERVGEQTWTIAFRVPRRRTVTAVVAVAALGLCASAFASIPDAKKVFHGCADKASGALRVIDTGAGQSCTAQENAVSWNQRGITWLGAWSSSTAYAVGDAVAYRGSSYVATVANTNVKPTDATKWNTLAKKGAQGVPGDPGPSGVVNRLFTATPGTSTLNTASDHWEFVGTPVPVTLAAGEFAWYSGDTTAYLSHQPSAGFAEFSLCFGYPGAAPGTLAQPKRVLVDGSFGAPSVDIPVSMSTYDNPGAGSWSFGLCARAADGIDGFQTENSVLILHGT